MSLAPVNLGSDTPAGGVASDALPAEVPKLPRPMKFLPAMGLLALLTGIGAFLRFWRLGFQSYWTDEGYTIGRIRGSFSDMLQQLNDQGFPPGWYALLQWWCNTFEKYSGDGAWAYSPTVTRSLTALVGTLTVPAMYFLARQFFERKGALLVTLLAAVNPFLIYYSRDIKMYAALWLFVVLNMAVFFRWQTTHRHWLWLPMYVITGAAMTATQAVAWFIPVLQLVFLLTRPRPRWLDGPLWLIGVALISLLPWYWYTEYVRPAQWMNRVSGNVSAGTMWYRDYTDMNWETAASLPTSQLLGYLWPVNPPDQKITNWFVLGSDFKDNLATRTVPWVADWEKYVAYALFAVMVLGLLPLRGWRRPKSPERLASVTRGRWWWVALWIIVPAGTLMLTWIPKNSPWHATVWHGFDVKPMWEPRYIGIIVPAWLLWLGASLGRLPTLPVRVLAIAFFAGASVASSLTNHLVYRNIPYGRAAEIAERYTPKEDRLSVSVAVPTAYHTPPAQNAALTVARKVRPGSPEDLQFTAARAPKIWNTGTVVWNTVATMSAARSWLSINASRARTKTLVLTDMYGDIEKPESVLSNESIGTALGPGWKLVHEEKYPIYYEWRFYIFHTWRTRVWQRVPVPPPARPAAPAATAARGRGAAATTAPAGRQPGLAAPAASRGAGAPVRP